MSRWSKYTNLSIDHDQKEVEIETLKEENKHIRQVAAREKQEFLNERQSNEGIAARWQVEKESKDARIAELEFAGELQAKKLVEREIMIAGRSDTVAALERQKSNLISQIKELKIDKIESQTRIAEMESAGEWQGKKFAERGFIPAGSYGMNTIAVLKGHKANLIAQVQELRVDKAESQARIAELESARERQAMTILGKNAILASHSDTIEVLKGQRANLLAQVEDAIDDRRQWRPGDVTVWRTRC